MHEFLLDGYSAAQIRDAEAPLLAAGEPLMQRAAEGLAREASRALGTVDGRDVLVLAGSGNNGGDALFAAAGLAGAGARVVVIRCGRRLHEEALAAAIRSGAVVLEGEPTAEVLARLGRDADLVLDGVLGTGAAASPALREPARGVVGALRHGVDRARTLVVAVDIPSGIGPDDGTVHDPVLPAHVTVTFGAMKAGLLTEPAASIAGEVRLVDIGLADNLRGVTPLVPRRS